MVRVEYASTQSQAAHGTFSGHACGQPADCSVSGLARHANSFKKPNCQTWKNHKASWLANSTSALCRLCLHDGCAPRYSKYSLPGSNSRWKKGWSMQKNSCNAYGRLCQGPNMRCDAGCCQPFCRLSALCFEVDCKTRGRLLRFVWAFCITYQNCAALLMQVDTLQDAG